MTNTQNLATKLIAKALAAKVKITVAESCTGGLIGAALTDVPGASAVFYGGFQTYANEAKINMLGVPPELIQTHGAVSQEVAASMAVGALAHSNQEAHLALSVTGIAGPGGGSLEKPVGLVWFGIARTGIAPQTNKHIFQETDRTAIRSAAVDQALRLLLNALD